MTGAQDAIKAIDPDILCLQEVRDWQAVQELVSVVPGMSVIVVSTFFGGQQQAIAAKLPSDSAWASKWQGSGKTGPPRGYAFAALRRPDGRMILVYSLHLKANGRGTDDAAKREDSSRQLLSQVAAMGALYKDAPVILAGDFNTTLDGEARFASERTLPDLVAAGFHWTAAGIPFENRITHPGSREWRQCPSTTYSSGGSKPSKCRSRRNRAPATTGLLSSRWNSRGTRLLSKIDYFNVKCAGAIFIVSFLPVVLNQTDTAGRESPSFAAISFE